MYSKILYFFIYKTVKWRLTLSIFNLTTFNNNNTYIKIKL